MDNYKMLYHIMVDAAERAIEAIDAQNYGTAKKILIHAEQEAEDVYINGTDGEESEAPAK